MRTRRSGLRQFLLLFFAFLLVNATGAFGQTQPRVVEAVDNARRVTLTGNVHPLARAEFDHGPADDVLPMTRILLLLKRGDDQEAALQSYLEQQQDKSSANYHVWLTPEQFGAQYGPADADIQAVTQWLGSQGFRIEKVYSGKTVIEFSGTAGQVRAAFGASIRNYLVNEKMYVANANDPQIPTALAPVVAGIVSLNNFPRQSHTRITGQARKIAGKPGLEPLFTFPNGSGGNFYGLAPGDFATIYNSKGLISSGNDGTGQTIAIVGETNIDVADVSSFRTMFGLPGNFSASNVILNGEDPGITSSDEEGEADLDTQWSGAVAPGATVDLVVSASTPASAGIDLSALYIIEHNLAGVMSESYGLCEAALGTAGNAFYNSLWEQAAAQGITVVLSTGDNGSAGCDDFNTATVARQGLAVSGLASTPYNVAVGGTDFDQVNKWSTFWSTSNATTGTDVIGTSALSYIPEIPWNQNCAQIGLTGCGATAPNGSLNIVAGSGGSSSVYGKPAWQMGVAGMPNDGHRDLPDISLFASPGFDGSGYIICQEDASGGSPCSLSTGSLNFLVIGGTSAAAPSFAGVMALVNQYQAAHGGTNRQGNANYVLYALAKKSEASCTSSATEATTCTFNDVVKGNSVLPTGQSGVGTNSVPCQGGTPNCSATVATQTGVLVEPTSATTEAWTVTAGYDLAAGLGSVNINNLATSWGTVNTVPTTTTLTLSPMTGITHGTNENVTVNITVTPKSGTATGDVSLIAKFADGTTQGLDQFTLASGAVTNAKTNSLPGGTSYQVYAHYAGDGTNAPSDSAAVTVSVGQESSQAFIVIPSFDSSGNLLNGNATSVPYGSNYIIRMYVTNSAATASATGPPNGACYQVNLLTCPTGKVTLTDNGTASGTGGGGAGIYNLNVAGYTRDLTPNLTGGTHALVATYSGDNSYNASSGSSSFTVTPAATNLTEQLLGVYPTVGVPFQAIVQGHSSALSGVAPTGTVTFYDGSTQLASSVPVSGTPGPQPSFVVGASLTIATAGSHTITAKYSGDTNYAASTTSSTVNIVYPTTASLAVNPSTVIYGSPVTITGIIDTTQPASNAALKPTGTISLSGTYDGPISNGVTVTAVSDASGNWELQITATVTPTNSQGYSLNYLGDANYAGGSAVAFVTVNIPDFSLTVPNGGLTITAGQSGTLTISVVPATNNASPVALSCAGSYPNGYGCSIQPSTVNLANGATSTATLTLSPSASPAVVRGKTLRRKHSGVLPVYIGPNSLWPLSVVGGLAAVLLLALYGRPRYLQASATFAVVCVLSVIIGCGGGGGAGGGGAGGGGGGGGGGGTGPFATTTTVSTSSAKVAQGNPVTFTATVSGSGNPTGTVAFYLNGSSYGQSTLVAGTATLTASIGSPGIYALTATYGGDAKNTTSTSPAVSQAVTGNSLLQINGQTSTVFHSVNVTAIVQ